MNLDSLKVSFSQAAENAKNENDIADAIKSLPAGATEEIADFIMEFCKAKGIDPQGNALQEYYKQTTEYKADTEMNAKNVGIDLFVTAMKDATSEIEENKKHGATPTPDRLDFLMGNITNRYMGLGGAQWQNKSPFMTFDEYINSQAKKEYWKEFSPKLFRGLPFPDGSFSVIGAAPGSGKTAALVNICRELLTTRSTNNPHPKDIEKAQDINAKRKILFVSAEMTAQDLTDRLIHSLAWHKVKNSEPYFLEKVEHTNIDYWKVLKYEYGNPPDYWTYATDELQRAKLYKEIIEEVHPLWNTRLNIAYVREHRYFEETLDIIKAHAEPGTVVLMDYLQLFKPIKDDSSKGGEYSPRYLQIRHIIDEAIVTAEKTNSVIICAAQLGRTDRQSGSTVKADDTQGFRESGDIEQNAWNIIKMFKEGDAENKQLSYRIAKARSSKHTEEEFILDWIPSYQYMENSGKKKPKKLKQNKAEIPDEQKERATNNLFGWGDKSGYVGGKII